MLSLLLNYIVGIGIKYIEAILCPSDTIPSSDLTQKIKFIGQEMEMIRSNDWTEVKS